jgi:hypothetical protein
MTTRRGAMKTTRFILILALAVALGILVPGRAAVPQQTAGELFEKALYVEEGQGDLQKAMDFGYCKRFPGERVAARPCFTSDVQKLGKPKREMPTTGCSRTTPTSFRWQSPLPAGKLEPVAVGTAVRTKSLIFKLDVADAGLSTRLSPDGSKLLYIGFQDKEPRWPPGSGFRIGQEPDWWKYQRRHSHLIFEWSPDATSGLLGRAWRAAWPISGGIRAAGIARRNRRAPLDW